MYDAPVIFARTAMLQALVNGPSYGNELATRIATLSLGRVRLLQASVYPALREMERDGLLEPWVPEEPESAGKRRYFVLTAKGLRLAKADRVAAAAIFRLLT